MRSYGLCTPDFQPSLVRPYNGRFVMKAQQTGIDLAIGLAAGYVATKATERAQMALWKVTPEAIQEKEQDVRPGPPPKMAAKQTAKWLDLDPDKQQMKMLSQAFHYGLGLAWGPIYGLLRRYSHMSPLGAGIVTGMSMSVIVDEALNPALGFTAPSREYPVTTHVRGFLGHLAFGLAAAATAEILYRATSRQPDRPS
jgi:uncharacterized membrane protein YagU involved in acid resistance